MKRTGRNRKLGKLQRNFIAFAIMSILVVVFLKMSSRNIASSGHKPGPRRALEAIGEGIARYAIEHEGRIPRKLSELYPEYCRNLGDYTSPYTVAIRKPEDIDRLTSFRINPAFPERLAEVHLRTALVLVSDTSPMPANKVSYCLNANLETMAYTEQSRKVFGLTFTPASLEKKEVDTDGDGKTDEIEYMREERIVYSINLLRDASGRVIREAWYDGDGRITTDYGPAFRMYNYSEDGNTLVITNRRRDGKPFEVFGVARVERKTLAGEKTREFKYYRADDRLIAERSEPVTTSTGDS